MAKITFNRNFSIGRVVAKLVGVTIALYVGNTIMNVLGNVLNGTEGPFNLGFKLLGWTVGGYPACGSGNYSNTCANICTTGNSTSQLGTSCITATDGTGVLAVIGLIGLASIVMEFVEFKMG